LAPISLNRAGVFKKSTTSAISCLTPLYPATSPKVVEGRSELYWRARDRPIDMIPDICPRAWRLTNQNIPTTIRIRISG
jgi:hypothetical protein